MRYLSKETRACKARDFIIYADSGNRVQGLDSSSQGRSSNSLDCSSNQGRSRWDRVLHVDLGRNSLEGNRQDRNKRQGLGLRKRLLALQLV